MSTFVQSILIWVFSTLLIASFSSPTRAQNQQNGGYRYQPPRPPPLEPSLEDDEIEELENDVPPGMGGRPVPLPSSNNSPPPTPPPLPGGGSEFRGSTTGFSATGTGKDGFHFHILDGEYYQRGKRRGRASDHQEIKSKKNTQVQDFGKSPDEGNNPWSR